MQNLLGDKTMPAVPEQTLVETPAIDSVFVANVRRKVPLLDALQPLMANEAEALMLALSEHLTNVLKYNSPTQVRIACTSAPKALRVYDKGADIRALWAGLDQQPEPDPLDTSGRGLYLIRQAFPQLSYHSSADGNCLILPLAAPKYRLAVIDDDPIQIALLSLWLGTEFQLETFTNPLQALAFLQLNPVDLIISDVCMPDLDGLSLRRELLSSRHASDIPFLFLSASSDETTKRSADDLAIDDFVTKPLREPSFLRQKVRRLLKRNQQVRQSVEVELDHAVSRSLWGTLDSQWQGWELNMGYLVASRGGGDFVFQQKRTNSLVIVIGDVMGHGLQAKFFAYAVSGYLYGLCHALSSQGDPAHLLSEISKAMAENELLQKTLVTFLVIELFADGTLLLASAGHPSPWLYDPNEGLTLVPVHGVLAGLQANAHYEMVQMHFQQGQRLLAATDGLTEQFPNYNNLDENQLTAGLAMLCSNPKPMKLLDFLNNNYAQPLADDLTLVSIRRM